uniref:Cytochrome c oxidase subunit 2 n=2 Tax=Hiatula TaxID=2341033 RepID=A0A4V1ER56_9BIVA|nr:cytochrome c oxidase subunit II [Hiatula diphos]YP_009642891.1 cytochrome c oxidase subunit II [Hiatula acuta]AEV94286.1 cytochrome c oxidase subunit II [Hiatula diphos]QCQ20455.1 cytochrome c oxidase subunit II [Hiatula acuta]
MLSFMPDIYGQMGLCDWGSSSGLGLIFLHDYLMCVCFMIMSVVGSVLVLVVPKVSYFCGGIHFRNVYRNNTLELWWTIIPIFIIIVMGYPSFVQLYAMGMNDKPKFITVKVTGHQWYWSYEYLVHLPSLINMANNMGLFNNESLVSGESSIDESGAVLDLNKSSDWLISYDSYTVSPGDGDLDPGFRYGQHVDYPMVLPGDSNVEVKVTSADVIHCWTIHGLGVKMDAVPGRVNTAHLSDLRPGFTAWGGCSEMCGVNHWQMSAEVEVLSISDFILWVMTWVYSDLKELD